MHPRSTNSSLAYSHGLSNNPKSATLNPNLNIQDQYVENLLKQIQFLSLQSKLLREKQESVKGPGLMSLINKQNKPVVEHLLISGDKYKDMRDQLSGKVNALKISMIELEGSERALIKRRDYVERRMKEAEQRNKNQRKEFEDKVGDLEGRIRGEKGKQEELEKENLRLVKGQEFSEGELEKINRDSDNAAILADTQSQKLDKEQQLQQQDQIKKQSTISSLKSQISTLQQQLQHNQKYLQLQQQTSSLTKQYQQQEKQLSELHFNLVKTEHIFKLAEIERDKEVKERRIAQEELEATQGLYKEIVKANEVKIQKRKKSRVNDSVDLKKGQMAISKLEKELGECKRRSDKAIETYNKYKIDNKAMSVQYSKITAKKKKLDEIYAKIIQSNTNLELQKEQLTKYIATAQKQIQKLRKQSTKLNQVLMQAEENYTQLHEQYNFLQGNVTLQEEIKKVNVEDLRSVVQKNLDVNNTVMELMDKWTDIQNFGRA